MKGLTEAVRGSRGGNATHLTISAWDGSEVGTSSTAPSRELCPHRQRTLFQCSQGSPALQAVRPCSGLPLTSSASAP
jgi:hypothetical protein